QVQNDPFGDPPQPHASNLTAAKAVFWVAEASVADLFRERVLALRDAAWRAAETTPGWTVADHVGHLAAWFEEAAGAIGEHRPGAPWRPLPREGVDAWTATDAARRRGTPPETLRAAWEAGRDRLIGVVRAMPDDAWLDPEGLGWAYEDLHARVGAHLAMIGPYAARARWPTG